MGDWYQQWIAFSSDEVVTPYRAIPWRRGLHTQRQKKSISLPWMVAFQAAMSVMGVIASSWALKTKSPKRPPIGSSNTKPVHPPPRELASSRSATQAFGGMPFQVRTKCTHRRLVLVASSHAT